MRQSLTINGSLDNRGKKFLRLWQIKRRTRLGRGQGMREGLLKMTSNFAILPFCDTVAGHWCGRVKGIGGATII